MVLDLQQYEGVPPLTIDDYSAGMKINIHDQRDPQQIMTQKANLLPVGVETVIMIEHEKVRSLCNCCSFKHQKCNKCVHKHFYCEKNLQFDSFVCCSILIFPLL